MPGHDMMLTWDAGQPLQAVCACGPSMDTQTATWLQRCAVQESRCGTVACEVRGHTGSRWQGR